MLHRHFFTGINPHTGRLSTEINRGAYSLDTGNRHLKVLAFMAGFFGVSATEGTSADGLLPTVCVFSREEDVAEIAVFCRRTIGLAISRYCFTVPKRLRVEKSEMGERRERLFQQEMLPALRW